jgi:predicted dehydrogenase
MNTRRSFLSRSGALAAAGFGFPGITRSQSPNSLLQVASIGVARMGGNTMRSVASHPKVQIVALCDVDADHLAQGAQSAPSAKLYADWREMLASHAGDFDAVTVGTPDHMHAPIGVTALRAGKHVYLQKPMAPTIHECRVLAAEAAKAGVVTQLGNQGRSSLESRMTVELIRSAIGKVHKVIFWENKALNWWPKNTTLRADADIIPTKLDWDRWLGVREARPYLHQTYHPQSWRAWFDFGVGELGDMGCHHFDSSVDALQLTPPIRVQQTQGGSAGPLWGEQRAVEMSFAPTAFTAKEGLTLTWLDGGVEPDPAVVQRPAILKTMPKSGGFWMGEKGCIFKPYGARPYLLPEAEFPVSAYPTGIEKRDHYHDWVDAILQGRKACADFSHGANLTEIVLVGTVADRFPGQDLLWDAAAGQFSNLPAANALVKRAYRPGWEIPGLG